jgi:hypothetical protein
VTAAVTCTCPQCNKSRHVLRRCRLLPVVPRAFWHVSGTTLRWVVRQPTLVAPWVAAFTVRTTSPLGKVRLLLFPLTTAPSRVTAAYSNRRS